MCYEGAWRVALSIQVWCAVTVCLCGSGLVLGQSASAPVTPLLTAPIEKLTVNAGFRDWSPATVASATIVAGNQTNRGGVVAIDTLSGKVKWTYQPVFKSGTASVSTAPAVAGDVVVTPFAAAYPGA